MGLVVFPTFRDEETEAPGVPVTSLGSYSQWVGELEFERKAAFGKPCPRPRAMWFAEPKR